MSHGSMTLAPRHPSPGVCPWDSGHAPGLAGSEGRSLSLGGLEKQAGSRENNGLEDRTIETRDWVSVGQRVGVSEPTDGNRKPSAPHRQDKPGPPARAF